MRKVLKSGVYIITNLINNKHYVGKATRLKARLLSHKNDLINNRHTNSHLQNSFNEYGLDNFSFEPLDFYDVRFISSMENWWCNMLNTHDRNYGFNILPTNPDDERLFQSEETKVKISISNTGKKRDLEHRKRLSEISSKQVHTPERKERVRLKHLGSKRSEESRKRMSDAQKLIFLKENVGHRKGKKRSDETKLKMSLSKSGKPSGTKGIKMKPENVLKNKLAQQKYFYTIQKVGGEITITDDLKGFCLNNKLNYPSLFKTLKGYNSNGTRCYQHKGYKILFRESKA